MRKKQTPSEKRERTLLETAVNMIGFLGLSPQSVFDLDPAKFNSRVSGLFMKLASEFTSDTLALSADLSLCAGHITDFRRTTIEHVNGGRPLTIVWKGGFGDTHDTFAHMARLTIAAAMYDILATRLILARTVGGPIPSDAIYQPLVGMVKFVESHRR